MIELEAGVRIGLFQPRLRHWNAWFHWLIKHNRLYPTITFLTRLVSVLVSTPDFRSAQHHFKLVSAKIALPATKGTQGWSASQFPSGLLSSNPRDAQMDRPGFHPLELRAAVCTANPLPPVCPLTFPLRPVPSTHADQVREPSRLKGQLGSLPPKFSFGDLSFSQRAATQMARLGLRERC